MEGHGNGRYCGIEWLWTGYRIHSEKLAAQQKHERERQNTFLGAPERGGIRVEDYNGVELLHHPAVLAKAAV